MLIVLFSSLGIIIIPFYVRSSHVLLCNIDVLCICMYYTCINTIQHSRPKRIWSCTRELVGNVRKIPVHFREVDCESEANPTERMLAKLHIANGRYVG